MSIPPSALCMDAIANTLSLRFGAEQVTFTPSEAASVSFGIDDVCSATSPNVDEPDETRHSHESDNHWVSAQCGDYGPADDICSVCEYEWDDWEWYYIIHHQQYGGGKAHLCGDCIIELQDVLDDYAEDNIGDALGESL